MADSARRMAFRVAATVMVVAGLLTWLALARIPATVVDAPDPWYGWLLTPAVIGMILSGGVHSGAPVWVTFLAMSAANAAFWATVVYVGMRAYTRMKTGR
jgi:hypothetical protein